VVLVFFGNDIQNNLWWMADLQENALRGAINGAFEERRRAAPTWPDAENIVLRKWYSSALIHFLATQWSRASTNVRNMTAGPPVSEVRGAVGAHELSADVVRGDSNWAPIANVPLERVEQGWRLTSTALAMLQQEVEQDGGQLAVVYLPYQERVHADQWSLRKRAFGLVFPDEITDFDRPRDRLREIAGGLEAEFVDLTRPLVAAADAEPTPLYYPIDGHLTERGHAVVADALAQWLSAKGSMLGRPDR